MNLKSDESVIDGSPDRAGHLRVAIVTASLGLAGAEKQAFYMAKALAEAGITVRVYNLLRGGEYENALRAIDVQSQCFGWLPGAPLRFTLLASALRSFRPHVIQSVHAWTNGYSALAARILGAVSIGGLRSDLASCLADNGRFAKSLLTLPDAVAVNSRSAMEQLSESGLVDASRIHFLPNAIDANSCAESISAEPSPTAIYVGRLVPGKRVDVFLRALAAARTGGTAVNGIVIGYGSEEPSLRKLAAELKLDTVEFLGFRDDATSMLKKASMFVFCSESEGTPNVLLEAMAAGLPVITTPAGDAAEMVRAARAGFVVPFGDVDATAKAIGELARSPELRRRFGKSGRDYVARTLSSSDLAARLMTIYRDVARACASGRRANIWKRVPQRDPG